MTTLKLVRHAISPRHWPARLFLLLALILANGCSVKRMALNMVGNALAESGSTFASDDDPELVEAAVPFSLKLMESLLAENPRHEGLLLAASSGFTQFAYAFVQQEADFLEATDFEASQVQRQRARKLYRRGKQYGIRALEERHPGMTEALQQNPGTALARTTREDVPILYWTALSWAALIASSKDDPYFIVEIPQMETLIDRALELNESWDMGAIHAFMITYEMSRQGPATDPVERSRHHFDRALQLSEGRLVAPLVSFAESVCVQNQDFKEFDRLLNLALAFDVDEYPDQRLVNRIMQQRAQWLRSMQEDLFIMDEPSLNTHE
jgi:hypothetical protein